VWDRHPVNGCLATSINGEDDPGCPSWRQRLDCTTGTEPRACGAWGGGEGRAPWARCQRTREASAWASRAARYSRRLFSDIPVTPAPRDPHPSEGGGRGPGAGGGGGVGLEKGTRKGRQPPTTSSQRSTPTPSWEGTDPSVAAKGAARGFTEPPPQSVAVTPPRLALANSIGRPHLPGGVPHPGRRPLGVGFLRCTVTTLKGEARLRRGGGGNRSQVPTM